MSSSRSNDFWRKRNIQLAQDKISSHHEGEVLEFNCVFTRTVFRSSTNDFVIASCRVEDTDNRGERWTCKGSIINYEEEQLYHLVGTVVKDKRYGLQLNIQKIAPVAPTSSDSIKAFLQSGKFKGVGPVAATKVVNYFGDDAFNILKDNPERVNEIKGLSKQAKQSLIVNFHKYIAEVDAIGFLASIGVASKTASAIYKAYGIDTRNIIENNPYVLINVKNFGFKKVDNIAKKIGIKPTDPKRIQAAIIDSMNYLCHQQGHTLIYYELLEPVVKERIALTENLSSILIPEHLNNLIQEKRLIKIHNDGYQLVPLRNSEKNIITNIKIMLRDNTPLIEKTRLLYAIQNAEATMGFPLTDEQKGGVINAMNHSFSLLTGAGGTGKTSSMRMVTLVAEFLGIPYVLISPTGKASKRLAQSCLREDGTEPENHYTIHRALGIGIKEEDLKTLYNEDENEDLEDTRILPAFKKAKLVLCDESSMLDTYLANTLIENSIGKHLVMIGDPNQLPSIGAGSVFKDFLDSKIIPTTQLTQIFRQAAESPVIQAANNVLQGRSPLTAKNITFYEASNDQIIPTIEKNIIPMIKKRGLTMNDIAFLSPMNQTPNSGVKALNAYLRPIMNPYYTEDPEYKGFQKGDYVMQKKNNYEVMKYNGDQGTVLHQDGEGIIVSFEGDEDNDILYENKESYENLMLSYATTIHKYQGSQCPIVIMILTNSHYIMLNRSILYTGITRAEKEIIFIGDKQAYQIAARNNKTTQRITGLSHELEYLANMKR